MKWMLEIMAFVHRTDTELLLKSRRVVPRRLFESGFEFDFPVWAAAAEELYRRWSGRSGPRILTAATRTPQ